VSAVLCQSATLVGVLGGPAAGLTTTAYAWSYDIGTIIFLLTVGLLSWSHREESFMSHVSSPGVGCVDSTSL